MTTTPASTRAAAPVWSAADAFVARILAVPPPRSEAEAEAAARSGDRLVGVALMVSAVRCTLTYVLLPFVLPFIGVLTGAARGITVAFDLVAMVAIVASVRRFWAARHPQRWRYLALALGVIAVSIFLLTTHNAG